MKTMLRPSLTDALKLNVGWVSPFFNKIIFASLYFTMIQG
jgi:hypothetical protein